MTVGDLWMSSSLKPLLEQAHLDSYTWVTALVQGLFLWKTLHGLWSSSGCIHLLHYGLLHRLHVEICSVWCPIGCRSNSTLSAATPAILLAWPLCLGCCLSPQFLIPLSQLLLCRSYCGGFFFLVFISYHRGMTGIVHWLSFGQGWVPFGTSWNGLSDMW